MIIHESDEVQMNDDMECGCFEDKSYIVDFSYRRETF